MKRLYTILLLFAAIIPISAKHGTQVDTLEAEVMDGRIILTPVFRHRSLQERAAAYGGDLRLSGELPREDPVGSEVW